MPGFGGFRSGTAPRVFRKSDVSGIEGTAMNCQNCNTKIDYRFLTTCTQCGCGVEPAGVSQLEQVPEPPEFEKSSTWRGALVNLVYLFLSSVTGMISGAVVVTFLWAVSFRAMLEVLDPDSPPGRYCGLGNTLGFLALYIGAFLGTMGGTVLAIKKPLCKAPAN